MAITKEIITKLDELRVALVGDGNGMVSCSAQVDDNGVTYSVSISDHAGNAETTSKRIVKTR